MPARSPVSATAARRGGRAGRPAGPSAEVRAVLRLLEAIADPARLAGMARYGIDTTNALGISVTELRAVARPLRRDHELAGALWGSGVHEARMLATLIDDPASVTEPQMETWIADVRSWDLCDGVCGNLFDRTPFWFDKAVEWAGREEEFVKRAGFALMAWGAVHRKDVPDERFREFLPLIRAHAVDERNYVRKAVNWALRQIGKRSPALNRRAIQTARQIRKIDSSAARWIAADALRELESDAVRERLGRPSTR